MDHKDETHDDGFHITIGNLNLVKFSISCSLMADGVRFTVRPDIIIDSEPEEVVPFPIASLDNVKKVKPKKFKPLRRGRLKFYVNRFIGGSNVDIPELMERLNEKK